MSSTLAPFGLRPVFKAGGTPASVTSTATLASGYSTAIGMGDPVKFLAGNIIVAGGIIATDTVGILGSFAGVEYTDSTNKPQVSNQWIASTVATNIVVYYTLDPYITYECQANATVAASKLGQQCDFLASSVGPASTTTGLSGAVIDATTVGTTRKLLRIVGLRPGPDNAWGDTYPILLVQVCQHQLGSLSVAGVS